MLKNKKSEAGSALIIIILIVLFLGWVINVSQRECKTNKDCASESYCGSDFSCHSYPNIQKTVVQYNFFWPAVVIGIAIIVAALIFNWNKIKQKDENAEEHKNNNVKIIVERPKEIEDVVEPYYKSERNNKI